MTGTIFISYSHDSPAHKDAVLGLAQRLRKDGLPAEIDQYVEGTPEQGWPRWALDQFDAAAFVLVVCSETYYRRFRGHASPGAGKGADFEGALITQEIFNERSATTKFVPVLLSAGLTAHIPEPIRGVTRYELTSEEAYAALLAFLRGAGVVEHRPLGAGDVARRRQGAPQTSGPSAPHREDDRVHRTSRRREDNRAAPTRPTRASPVRAARERSVGPSGLTLDRKSKLRSLYSTSRTRTTRGGHDPMRISSNARSTSTSSTRGKLSARQRCDPICASLFGSRRLRIGQDPTFTLWLYAPQFRAQVRELASAAGSRSSRELDAQAAAGIKVGSRIRAAFTLRPGAGMQPLAHADVDSVWNGTYISLAASLAMGAAPPQVPMQVSVRLCVEGFHLATLTSTIEVLSRPPSPARHPRPSALCQAPLPRSGFASYARKDRKAAILVKQALEVVLPGFELFVDCATVRAGTKWAGVLYNEIRTRDCFLLFWSAHALRSTWVRREWRYALRKRGLSFITPVALVLPHEAPPPPELRRLHFDDPFNPARFVNGS